MTYFQEFKNQIALKNWNKCLELWEEYVQGEPNVPEFLSIFEEIKRSDWASDFGKVADMGMLLWERVSPEDSYTVLRAIVDLDRQGSHTLREAALQAVKNKYQGVEGIDEALRLSGLLSSGPFPRAMYYVDFYFHIAPGNCIFHDGGWGVGEIMEVSRSQESAVIEFEQVTGRKRLPFFSIFKNTKLLENTCFLSRRFVNPDLLEKEARENPLVVVKLLLRDLGPKTAAEIKEEMVDLVIPEKDFSRWWQRTKALMKKDPYIAIPEKIKDPYFLLEKIISDEEKIAKCTATLKDPINMVSCAYKILKEISPEKKDDLYVQLRKTFEACERKTVLDEMVLDGALYDLFEDNEALFRIKENIEKQKDLVFFFQNIHLLSLKKKLLNIALSVVADPFSLLFSLLLNVDHASFRDFVLEKLMREYRDLLEKEIKMFMVYPERAPAFFFWYFQKMWDKKIPFIDSEERVFEAFFNLLCRIEFNSDFKETTKKMLAFITRDHFLVVRRVLEGKDLEFVKEFLLLASKCRCFDEQDLKTLRSLAAVVRSELTDHEEKAREKYQEKMHTLWTTEAAYQRKQQRIVEITSQEMIRNAKEVEAARALGDLRENAEYKAATEKRATLQRELKTLSEEMDRARVITPSDLSSHEVGIGSVVEIENSHGNRMMYTILGPWDVDVDKNILSIHSQFAEAMCGKRVDDEFVFREERYRVVNLHTIFS